MALQDGKSLTIMDLERSSRRSGASSSRSHSISFSNAVCPLNDDDPESETVSEAGDIGDRALESSSGSAVEIISPLSSEGIIGTDDKKQENKKGLPRLLEYISCLVHLAVFGILGVLTRYLLENLFGPGVLGITSEMYIDLPANMAGSFLMGWWGIVFKGDISRVSDHLAVGLTTGFLGSLTTFSDWNQKLLDVSVKGKWASVVIGFFIGLLLADSSINLGVLTAQGFKWLLQRFNVHPLNGLSNSKSNWKVHYCKRQFAVVVALLLLLGLLWGVCGALEMREFHSGSSGAQLWLACIVGPLGVWIRWLLASLNGQGIGQAGWLKWFPFGTLTANVSAACIMAALATLDKAVKTKNCHTIVVGIQFGFLGCLSTVSAFIAEFRAMEQSSHPWRAYAYALITIMMSFSLGTLIYSVPVWVKGYILYVKSGTSTLMVSPEIGALIGDCTTSWRYSC